MTIKFSSEAPKGIFFNVLINRKKRNHSFSRCWPCADRTLHQECSWHSGEMLRYRKQCGVQEHKEGIWGLPRGDGEGTGVT